MRLTLLFFFLFTVLGGCTASPSCGTIVSSASHYAGKQQFSASHISLNACLPEFNCIDITDTIIDDDMEDEDRDSQPVKIPAGSAPASVQLVMLSRFHDCISSAPPVAGILFRKYIAQRTLRV